jgi:ribosomal protein S27AE
MSSERALVAVSRGKYGTINTSGASGGNFCPATYCTRGLVVGVIMYAYDDRWFCIKCTKIKFDLNF